VVDGITKESEAIKAKVKLLLIAIDTELVKEISNRSIVGAICTVGRLF
jgi:hypothetical protein